MTDPTTQWLRDNVSLDTEWPEPRPVEVEEPQPAEEGPRWRRTRAAARVAGQAAPYVASALWLASLASSESDQPGGGVWG